MQGLKVVITLSRPLGWTLSLLSCITTLVAILAVYLVDVFTRAILAFSGIFSRYDVAL